MRLKLQKYQSTVKYMKGKELFVADTLSRAVFSDDTQSPPIAMQECEVFRLEPAQMNLTLNRVTVDTMKRIR